MSKRLAMPTLAPLYGAEKLPGFSLTFLCDGRDFTAWVRARNAQAATEEALCELAAQCPDFDPDSSRLTRCIQGG